MIPSKDAIFEWGYSLKMWQSKRKSFDRYSSTYLALAAVSLLLVSCESKVSQCGKVQQVIAKESSLTNSANPERLVDLPNNLDLVTTELEGVKVGDGNLQNTQKSLISSYKNLSQSIRNAAAAIDKVEVKNIKTSLKDLERAKDQKQSLVNDINSYCVSK